MPIIGNPCHLGFVHAGFLPLKLCMPPSVSGDVADQYSSNANVFRFEEKADGELFHAEIYPERPCQHFNSLLVFLDVSISLFTILAVYMAL